MHPSGASVRRSKSSCRRMASRSTTLVGRAVFRRKRTARNRRRCPGEDLDMHNGVVQRHGLRRRMRPASNVARNPAMPLHANRRIIGSSGRERRMTALSSGVAAINTPAAKAVKNREIGPTTRIVQPPLPQFILASGTLDPARRRAYPPFHAHPDRTKLESNLYLLKDGTARP